MIRLFVDDMREVPDSSWHLARTITEAIRILSGPLYVETVSLDHDIILPHAPVDDFMYEFFQLAKDHGYVVPTDKANKIAFAEETFASVARYIAVMPKERLPKIVYIHTANLRGASDMEEILKGIVPVIRVGDSVNFNFSSESTYKEDLTREEEIRKGLDNG